LTNSRKDSISTKFLLCQVQDHSVTAAGPCIAS